MGSRNWYDLDLMLDVVLFVFFVNSILYYYACVMKSAIKYLSNVVYTFFLFFGGLINKYCIYSKFKSDMMLYFESKFNSLLKFIT